ncbi:type II secretion system F family protein [Streptomyces sp. AM 4-1-1]|uniref:type II secretion system F family protein n=1 Tax=Streptomyces sp. AM 4-1-1 TaxID=3028710 RepID=UPI0023B98573|nr:type II secretion system F family protein [Streptomyces sp. AM 4-1-1]WEH35057.1 type II secretion system F family protein [Streptomyces sp. AM 4-1-1]
MSGAIGMGGAVDRVSSVGEFVHELAMVAALGAVMWLVALSVRHRQARVNRRRGASVLGVDQEKPPRRWLKWCGPAKEWSAPVAGAVTGWILAGGVVGGAVGAAGGYAVRRWRAGRGRRDPGASVPEAAAVARQLPLLADLLAACVSAGAGPREAAEAVGEALGGPAGERLARTAAEIRLGGEPADAWARFGEIPGAAALARCLYRAGASGAPAAEPVSRLADGIRAERADAALARAQRAGVLITAPVGLCFLPAFLAVGVAPVVIGLATGLLHGA